MAPTTRSASKNNTPSTGLKDATNALTPRSRNRKRKRATSTPTKSPRKTPSPKRTKMPSKSPCPRKDPCLWHIDDRMKYEAYEARREEDAKRREEEGEDAGSESSSKQEEAGAAKNGVSLEDNQMKETDQDAGSESSYSYSGEEREWQEAEAAKNGMSLEEWQEAEAAKNGVSLRFEAAMKDGDAASSSPPSEEAPSSPWPCLFYREAGVPIRPPDWEGLGEDCNDWADTTDEEKGSDDEEKESEDDWKPDPYDSTDPYYLAALN